MVEGHYSKSHPQAMAMQIPGKKTEEAAFFFLQSRTLLKHVYEKCLPSKFHHY